MKNGNIDTPAANYLKKHVTRDLINLPKGYAISAIDYGKTIGNISKSTASAIKTAINKNNENKKYNKISEE